MSAPRCQHENTMATKRLKVLETSQKRKAYLEGVILAGGDDPASLRLQRVDWLLVGAYALQQRAVYDMIPAHHRRVAATRLTAITHMPCNQQAEFFNIHRFLETVTNIMYKVDNQL